jgi:hypothetical protein
MFLKLYTSYDSGPKLPLIGAWPPSPNFVSCLSEPSNASSDNAIPTMNMPKVEASKFHVLDDLIDSIDPNEIVALSNSQSDQVLKR